MDELEHAFAREWSQKLTKGTEKAVTDAAHRQQNRQNPIPIWVDYPKIRREVEKMERKEGELIRERARQGLGVDDWFDYLKTG